MGDDKSLNKELCWIPGRVLEDLTGPVLEIVNPWDQFKAAVWVVFFERFLHYNCPELSGLWLNVVIWHHELWAASERKNVHNPPFSLMHTLKSSHSHFLLVWYMISSQLCVQLLLQTVKKKRQIHYRLKFWVLNLRGVTLALECAERVHTLICAFWQGSEQTDWMISLLLLQISSSFIFRPPWSQLPTWM